MKIALIFCQPVVFTPLAVMTLQIMLKQGRSSNIFFCPGSIQINFTRSTCSPFILDTPPIPPSHFLTVSVTILPGHHSCPVFPKVSGLLFVGRSQHYMTFPESSNLLLRGRISAVMVLAIFFLLVPISPWLALSFLQEGDSSLSCWATLQFQNNMKDGCLTRLLIQRPTLKIQPCDTSSSFSINTVLFWPEVLVQPCSGMTPSLFLSAKIMLSNLRKGNLTSWRDSGRY